MAGAPYAKDEYDPVETFAYEQLTLSSGGAATALTSATYNNAKRAVVTLEGDSARYRTDPLSSAVTTAIGTPMAIADQIILWGSVDIQQFRIAGNSTSAKLNCEYGR